MHKICIYDEKKWSFDFFVSFTSGITEIIFLDVLKIFIHRVTFELRVFRVFHE